MDVSLCSVFLFLPKFQAFFLNPPTSRLIIAQIIDSLLVNNMAPFNVSLKTKPVFDHVSVNLDNE